ncbi:MAG: DUF354 domain-containing protein [Candidatus Bathyarchaeia archaeon]
MRVWYDACTGKHVRYGTTIARKLRSLGHEVILTTRRHPDTLALASLLKEDFVAIGRYSSASLFSKLKESTKRTSKLAEFFKNNLPDVAISHQSVELCRVAFGLAIPIILTADTPHADAVNRLTIPLSKALVVSEAIPKRLFACYGKPKIYQFKGVDEVAWIKGFSPTKDFNFERPLIVVRQLETRASYALEKEDVTEKAAKKLAKLGNVLFISRYGKQKINGVTTLEKFVDTASLVASADLVVSAGGTISREAALQGTPSIVISEFGKTYVNEYLAKKGFPLFMANASDVISIAKRYIGKRFDVQKKLSSLEDPVDIIVKVISENFNKSC